MKNFLWVGTGGFIGSVLRYWLGGYLQNLSRSVGFPYGTLAVNLIGCLLIGFLSQLAEARGVFSPEARLLVFTGVLGGFTTFSTFSNETLNLLRGGENLAAALNLGLHLAAGLAAVWLGRLLAQAVWR